MNPPRFPDAIRQRWRLWIFGEASYLELLSKRCLARGERNTFHSLDALSSDTQVSFPFNSPSLEPILEHRTLIILSMDPFTAICPPGPTSVRPVTA